jgi:hypothetical protein
VKCWFRYIATIIYVIYIILGISGPVFVLEPSPPQVQDKKRKRKLEVQENKRMPKFDDAIVISNA